MNSVEMGWDAALLTNSDANGQVRAMRPTARTVARFRCKPQKKGRL